MAYGGNKGYILRRRWISKALRHMHQEPEFLTRPINKITDTMGYSQTMMQSLKHWLKTTGIVNGKYMLTQMGQFILQHDRYIESIATKWLIQYNISNKLNNAPILYFFNNELALSAFDKDILLDIAHRYCLYTIERYAERETIKSELDTILQLYGQKNRDNPEDFCTYGSELDELEFVKQAGKVFSKRKVRAEEIPPEVAYFCFMEWVQGIRDISVKRIMNSPGSPVKAFNLDRDEMFRLIDTMKAYDYLHYALTAGVDMVYLHPKDHWDELKKYYVSTFGGVIA